MTPIYCPRCRHPVEGELEHGVCPVRQREVEPHVFTYPVLVRIATTERERREEDFGEPLTPIGSIRRHLGCDPRHVEDFGQPLTPFRVTVSVWAGVIWKWLPWVGLSALVAAIALSAWMICEYGRLLP